MLTRKRLRRLFLLFVAVSLLLPTGRVNATTDSLHCWYAYEKSSYTGNDIETEHIGTRKGNPIKLSEKKLDTESSFHFYSGNLHAKKEWESALDITIQPELVISKANLKIYGGTRQDISQLDPKLTADEVGVTYPSWSANVYDLVTLNNGSSSRSVYVHPFTNSVTYIVSGSSSNSFFSDSYVSEICTHEMGHALGWYGHSKSTNDLMYYSIHGKTSLTSHDIDHLAQVY